MSTLRKAAIRLAYDNPGPIREALLPLLTKQARPGDPKQTAWVKIFDDMASKRLKTLQMDAGGTMGGGTNGFRTFKRGRMGKPRRWSGGVNGGHERVSMSIIGLDADGKPMRSRFKLWRSVYDDGTASISASVGDMGLMLKGLKAGS